MAGSKENKADSVMEAIKSLEQEKAELNTLINKGIEFEVADVEFEKKPGLFGKRVPVTIKKKFKIDEPTLGTLDRLSAEWIELAIDESQLKADDGLQKARTLVNKHAKRMAKVVALAVMGSAYLVPTQGRNGVVQYREDTKRLNELSALFLRTIKPSDLYQLCVMINAMCNLGDFLNSIRLMSGDRTAMPIRIEESTEA